MPTRFETTWATNPRHRQDIILSSVADPDPFDTDPGILLFTLIPLRIQILLTGINLIQIRIQLFETDLDQDQDPYCFKEVMYLKQYFLYIFTWFSLSLGPTRRHTLLNFPFQLILLCSLE